MMRRYGLCALVTMLTLVTVGCERTLVFSNWGFEEGNLNSWITEGAFNVSQATRYAPYRYYMQEGNNHVTSSIEGTGFLRSPSFIVAETGHISLLIGAASSPNDTYVSFHRSRSHEEIARITNIENADGQYDENYLRYIVDLSEYLNTLIYIKVVDESTIARINVDDFRVAMTTDQLHQSETDILVRLGLTLDPDMRKAADTYIRQNAFRIDANKRFRFHLTGETGWINDPNGFSFYHDEINLFYQHNPYATIWGPMHWGHATSPDFVHWEYQDVALAPDRPYDTVGAFSGSAIEWNGKYYLIYTGASTEGQVQCMAISDDGVRFEKYGGNPIIDSADLPADTSIADFRDPKIFTRDGWVYMIIAARNISNQYSKLLLYKTQNMTHWQYAGRVLANNASLTEVMGVMMECPDLISFEDEDVILVSPQSVTNHRNADGNIYISGNMNWATGQLENFNPSSIKEIDHGFDFYAAQTMEHPDGRLIMVAWMAGWSRRPITSEFGYAGAMTFPRSLTYQDGHLYQLPVEELMNYRRNYRGVTFKGITEQTYDESIKGNVVDIEATFAPSSGKSGLTFFDDKQGHRVVVYYEEGRLYLERFGITDGYYPSDDKNNRASMAIPLVEGKVVLRVLLDKYSIEIFAANGYGAMTATGMPSETQMYIGAFADQPTDFDISMSDII